MKILPNIWLGQCGFEEEGERSNVCAAKRDCVLGLKLPVGRWYSLPDVDDDDSADTTCSHTSFFPWRPQILKHAAHRMDLAGTLVYM